MGKTKNTDNVNLDHVWAETDTQLEEQKRAAAIQDVKLKMCPQFPAKDLKPGTVSKKPNRSRGKNKEPHFRNNHKTREEEEGAIEAFAKAIVAELNK